jgi:hypothetical protein
MSFAQAQKEARAKARATAVSSAPLEETTQEDVYLYALPADIRKDVVADNAKATEAVDKSIAEITAQLNQLKRQKAIALEEGALAELDLLLGYGEFPEFTSVNGVVLSFFVAAQKRQDLYDLSCTLGVALKGVTPGVEHSEWTAWTAKSVSKQGTTKRVLSHEDKAELDALESYFDGFQGVGIAGMRLAGRRLAELKRGEKNIAI